MFKKMPVCRLMISCPSDVKTEIEIINRVVDNINDSIGFSMNIFVKTLYWSKNVMPEAGEYPQSIINKQILDKSDAIIAIFGNRIGSPTQHYESGTIEEIELMIQKGKQVFVYFSDKPVRKSEIDMEAETKIQAFKEKYKDRGIYVVYASDEEFNDYVSMHLTRYLTTELANEVKGKIVCGDCGKGMRLSPRTTKSYVYFCGTFSDGINPACSRHKIDQEDVNKAVFAQISNHMRCCIDALRVIRELNARSSGLKKYDVYEKAITRQRRELEKVNRKFSELYGDYSEHLINESEYLTLKQQYLLKSEALKKEIDNLLISQNLYSKNYKIDADWENLINKYLKCRKLNKELADAFVDKVQVFEGGRISVNLVYDDCLEELLQVKNKREGDLNE